MAITEVKSDLRDELHEKRVAMRRNGYQPLANKDKRCFLKGRNNLDITDELLAKWRRDHEWKAVGLRLKDTPTFGIDVDVDSEEWIDAFRDRLTAMGGNVARFVERCPIRYGKGAKELWLGRLADGEENFSRCHSMAYFPSADVEENCKVEIWGGDSGSQLAVYGAHTVDDSGKVLLSYEWLDDLGPAEVPLSALPALTRAEIEVIRDTANAMMEELGWIEDEASSIDGPGSGGIVYDLPVEAVFQTPKGPKRYDQLEEKDRVQMKEITGEGENPRGRGAVYEYSVAGQSFIGVWDSKTGITHLPVAAEEAARAEEAETEEVLSTLAEELAKQAADENIIPLFGGMRMEKLAVKKRAEKIETSALALLAPYDHDAPASDYRLEPPVLKDIVRKGELGVVVGLPGVGKTPLMMLIAAAVCTGRGDLIGLELDRPYSVAVMNAEQPEKALRAQFKATLEEYGLRPIAGVMFAGQERLVEGEEDLAELIYRDGGDPEPTAAVDVWKSAFEAAGSEFLLLDPVNEFMGGDEDKRADAKLFIKTLKGIMHAAEERQMSGLMFAHTGKVPAGKAEDWYHGDISAQRGSSAAAGRIDAHTTLTPKLSGKNAAKKQEHRARQLDRSDPTPNVIEWYVKKAKMAEEQVIRFYEVKTSKFDQAIPVCKVMSREEIQQAENAGSALVAVVALAETLDKFGGKFGYDCDKLHDVSAQNAAEIMQLDVSSPSWTKPGKLKKFAEKIGRGWHKSGDHEYRLHAGKPYKIEIKEVSK